MNPQDRYHPKYERIWISNGVDDIFHSFIFFIHGPLDARAAAATPRPIVAPAAIYRAALPAAAEERPLLQPIHTAAGVKTRHAVQRVVVGR